ncbi:hypothetical protein [Corynebacterium sp. ES2775-CONJ]|uniref:hypothetical protein n=1 Tax=Corynebacterium sp. ES2775-CONJ TaxID=2974029 RepID=UPI0021673849|nr:hypothetical protein [Corynebacterium sp. ES2775-CONJ]
MYRKPEILRSTVSSVLETLNQAEPTYAEVTKRHRELNDQVEEMARSLAPAGQEPSPRHWEEAYSEIIALTS